MADLLILAQHGSWEIRFQVSSLAASAAASGARVDVALFFGALDAWVGGRWDELDPDPPIQRARLESLAMPPLTSLIANGRSDGTIHVYACSASARLLGLDTARVQAAVDAMLGWQTFSRMIEESERVVTL
ncbi:MAG TPA: hypothetical protein VIH93_03980 [Thermoanaerobaculia bacterium]